MGLGLTEPLVVRLRFKGRLPTAGRQRAVLRTRTRRVRLQSATADAIARRSIAYLSQSNDCVSVNVWFLHQCRIRQQETAQDRSDAFIRWFLPVFQYGATITCAEDLPLAMRRRSLTGSASLSLLKVIFTRQAAWNVKNNQSA